MTETIGVAVCSHFFRELQAAVQLEAWSHVVPLSFPALCGRPPLTQEHLNRLSDQHASCTFVHVLGNGCCTKVSADLSSSDMFNVHAFNPCFTLFSGKSHIQSLCDEGGYLLSPGWLAGWRGKLRRDGFDQASARQFYGESVKSLVLLDTGVDPQCEILLKEFGEFLGLPFRTVKVGLDHFRLLLWKIIGSRELNLASKATEAALKDARGRIAEYSMMSEILARIAQIHEETDALTSIFELVQMLFAPQRINYAQWIGGAPVRDVVTIPPRNESDAGKTHGRLADYSDEYGRTEDGNGFYMRFTHRREIMGIIELEGVAFPNNIDRYLNTLLSIMPALALAIANIRAYSRLENQFRENRSLLATIQADIEDAGKIQWALLPRPVEQFSFLDVSWYFRPCSTVGGDLLNIFQPDKNHVVFYVFDVSGHGVQAALSAVSIHEMLSSFRLGDSPGETEAGMAYRPKEVAKSLNGKFGARKHGYFTLTYGIIDIATGILKYTRAGHTPLLLKEAGGELRILDEGNSPIGMFPDAEFNEKEIRLSHGDRLIIYSDGITEARNFASSEFYGEDRLSAVIRATGCVSVKDCVSGIVNDLMTWLGESKPVDDICLLAIDITPRFPMITGISGCE